MAKSSRPDRAPQHAAFERSRAARILALFCGFWLLAAAQPVQGQVLAEPPLNRASRCYVQSDLLCVLQVLETAKFDLPNEQNEALRLLAFAYARLDRHAEARKTFGQWLALQPGNRLERTSTPPAIFEDYAAAQLLAHQSELDLQPHLEGQAVLPPPAVSPTDLPHFAPPPRSGRDQANDFMFGVFAGANLDLRRGGDSAVLPAGQIALDLMWNPWTLGMAIGGRGAARVTTFTEGDVVGTVDTTALVTPVLLRVGRMVIGNLQHGLAIVAGGGGALESNDVTAVVSAGLRYTWLPAGSAIGLCAEARDDLDVSGPWHTPMVQVGACFRPARTKSSAQRPSGAAGAL